jgi:hypothetical protein
MSLEAMNGAARGPAWLEIIPVSQQRHPSLRLKSISKMRPLVPQTAHFHRLNGQFSH